MTMSGPDGKSGVSSARRAIGEDELFLPDLCSAESVFYLVVVVELLVLVLTLADSGLANFSWSKLGLVSLFVQWVALCSAGILCRIRAFLGSQGNFRATILSVAVVFLVTLAFSIIGERLVRDMGDFPSTTDWSVILRNLMISMIMTGLVFRYLYLQQQLVKQNQAELNSRIQALQSRIRPHFLFNSMNIIASLISVDPELAEQVVEDLSVLFRASLSDSQGRPVKLSEELRLCERYIRIESLRMDERLQVEWNIDLDADRIEIPLLTLQPLLENAIYHGIQPVPEGGKVQVVGQERDGMVTLSITNPLPVGNGGHTEGNRMALENIRQRLIALHGNRAEVVTRVVDDRFETRITYPG